MSRSFANDPKDVWGANLDSVFGQTSERVHISEIDYAEKQKRIMSVPAYVDTDDLGQFPSLYEVVNKVLRILKHHGALKGIDLDWQDEYSLVENGLTRHREVYKHTSKMYKNNKVQRGIQLRHLLEDILFNYDPKKVLTGLARYDKVADRFYMNDAQHRNVASIILGIRHIPVEYEVSSSASVDVEQYGCVNINSLSASEFDKYRNRVQQYLTREAEGLDVKGLDPQVHIAHALHQLVEVSYGIRIVEKGSTKNPHFNSCVGIGNLLRDYQLYGPDIFSRAVAIVSVQCANVRTHIPQQMIEMVCKFLKLQQASAIHEHVMDIAIEDALEHWCPKKDRVVFHQEAARACNNGPYGYDSDTSLMTDSLCDLQTRWAAGLLKIVRVTSPNLEWESIKVKGVDIAASAMPDFVVMPKLQKVA